MISIKDPNLMTGQERLAAICTLLANAILRKLEREAKQAQIATKLPQAPKIAQIETQTPGWIVLSNIKYHYTINGI